MSTKRAAGPVYNLFADIPAHLPEERFDTVVDGKTFRLERIVSTGHASPAGHWYDQDRDEWVVVLRGSASLLFEEESEARTLREGDAVLIPAHCRHRVVRTDSEEKTVWLALHFDGSEAKP